MLVQEAAWKLRGVKLFHPVHIDRESHLLLPQVANDVRDDYRNFPVRD